jgi:transposase-like protein
VRQDGQVRDAAVLMARGIDLLGKRNLLGVSASLGEHEIHWRIFLESLVARGLRGVQHITSNDHRGLKAARLAVFGGIPWQCCQFHLQQNASAYVPRQAMLSEVVADIRAIFNAPNRSSAEAFPVKTIAKYEKTASKLAIWLEANIPEGLTVFAFPAAHLRLISNTNGLKRVSREVYHRTRVVGISNIVACLRLVSAILMEIDDAWQAGSGVLNS